MDSTSDRCAPSFRYRTCALSKRSTHSRTFPPSIRSARANVSPRKVNRHATGRPISARNTGPSTLTAVSWSAGTAARPSAAQSKVGGGTIRRTISPPGAASESPIRTAYPPEEPKPKKKSKRALSGDAMRATPSPRLVSCKSVNSHVKTIWWRPAGSPVRGIALAGAGTPVRGPRRGTHATSVSAAKAPTRRRFTRV